MLTENMKDIDIIIELESGELIINTKSEWDRVKNIARSLAPCQDFYSHLYRCMLDFENDYDEYELPFPIYL